MSETTVATCKELRELAERLARGYVRELLNADELAEHIEHAWQTNMPGETPQGPVLEALARGIGSQVLCEACQASRGWRREIAFERLREYLFSALGDRRRSAHVLPQETREEIVQQTCVEILQNLQRERGKPEQPRAFLAWARVILYRQLALYWRQRSVQQWTSLEEEEAPLLAEIVDEHAPNPLSLVIGREQGSIVRAAIEHLRNPNYRAVLRNLYLREMDASEVARELHVSVAAIHLWHHRALSALHKQLSRQEAL